MGRFIMSDTRVTLEVLKAELAFLDGGGYSGGPRHPWRPNFVFEDSPTCINFKAKTERKPCSECRLISFVPKEKRDLHFPCRYIRLTNRGETVNSFYQCGTEKELEEALRSWLVETIEKMEKEDQRKGQTA